jgi:urease accessory protein
MANFQTNSQRRWLNSFNFSPLVAGRSLQFLGWLSFGWFALTQPASAHHAMGNQLPTNAWEGFLSGLAHPVIGLDHLAFVIAIGLLSAQYGRGVWLPACFLLAALAGTGLHVLSMTLPLAELAIALSVILIGMILGLGKHLPTLALAALMAGAGLFHGYAYGESIVGAEPTPLIAYLLGFTVIQYGIARLALTIAQRGFEVKTGQTTPHVQYFGYIAFGIGLAALATAIGA